MTRKEYIGAFLDGYFSDKKNLEYGFEYFQELDKANKLAIKKWNQFKKQKL